jgi:hypothetical protein
MTGNSIVHEPFHFFTKMHLSELTGLRAGTLDQLVDLLQKVPGSCVYYHTHRFLQQHLYLNPEPPNDFSYWVNDILGEDELGEQLASIDIVQFPNIRALREAFVRTIGDYIAAHPKSRQRFARDGEEFHFIKAVSFVFPTAYMAYTPAEFARVLKDISIDSIYFHMFEARLRLEKNTNDFSRWFEVSVGDPLRAAKIARIDPYTHTLEDLRNVLVGIVEDEG